MTDYWIHFSLSKVKGDPIYQEHWIPLLLQVQCVNRRFIHVLFDSDLLRSSAILVLNFTPVQSLNEIGNEIPRVLGSVFVAYPLFGR